MREQLKRWLLDENEYRMYSHQMCQVKNLNMNYGYCTYLKVREHLIPPTLTVLMDIEVRKNRLQDRVQTSGQGM